MDEKMEILISLGASTAANCVPCYGYYFKKATKQGLRIEDIEKAVEIGNKVKTGASIAMTKSIRNLTACNTEASQGDGSPTDCHPCCS